MTANPEFTGELEIPPQAKKLMRRLNNLTGCTVILFDQDLMDRFDKSCEYHDVDGGQFLVYVIHSITDAILDNKPGINIELPQLPDAQTRPGPPTGPETIH